MSLRFAKLIQKVPAYLTLSSVTVDAKPTDQTSFESYVKAKKYVDGAEVNIPVADIGFTFADAMAYEADLRTDAMADLRTKRNELLQEADSVTMSCYSRGIPVPADWATYQQTLRDLPENSSPDYDDAGQLTGVTFPTAPATKP